MSAQKVLLLVVAFACLAISGRTTAQQQLSSLFAEASDALAHGRYFDASEILRRLAIDGRGKIIDVKAYMLWSQIYVDVAGEPYSASANSEDDDPSIARELAGATAEPAIAAIAGRARKTRIVILNEDHRHSSQRAFAMEVARALRPLGYNVLALEALNNRGDSESRMSALEHRGYVVLDDGFYTRDPVFADFIRQAIRVGYAPASYEYVGRQEGSGDEAVDAREQGQAENLLAIVKKHPTSKLFIYVGQSHVAEAPLDHGNRKLSWMAARLAKLSGINPLTIDQTTLQSGCHICGQLTTNSHAVVFFRRSHPVVAGQYAGAVDLQLFKPAQRSVHGRPAWLLSMGRSPVPVPRALLPMRGQRLVQAFVASEPADAIPLDQFIARAGSAPPKFVLPHVKVRFAFQESRP